MRAEWKSKKFALPADQYWRTISARAPIGAKNVFSGFPNFVKKINIFISAKIVKSLFTFAVIKQISLCRWVRKWRSFTKEEEYDVDDHDDVDVDDHDDVDVLVQRVSM